MMQAQNNPDLANVAVFPSKKPEILIGRPEQSYPELSADQEFAIDTQTWD